MLNFKKIKIKNFLSCGNKPIEISLDEHSITLVHGDNGAMKSGLFCDAIFYALYGKSFRKVNLSNMINNINKKELIVEIEFSNDQNEYRIVRGMKPNKFEIYINNVLKEQSSSVRDYQNYLSNYIIKMDEKTFRQLAIIGSSSYIPFMNLSAGERRTVIEDLLQIDIFSYLLDEAKQKNSEIVSEVKLIDNEIVSVSNKIELNCRLKDEKIKHAEESVTEFEKLLEEKIKERVSIISQKENILSKINKERIEEVQSNMKKIDSKNKVLISKRGAIISNIERENKDISFFESHDVCPVCTQKLSKEFIFEKIQNKHEGVKELKSSLENIDSNTEIVSSAFNKLNEELEEYKNICKEFSLIEKEIKRNEYEIKELESKINSFSKKQDDSLSNLEDIISDLNKDKKEIEDKLDKVKKEREIMNVILSLLKDDGIKLKIIKTYLPVINKLIKKYLDIVGFNISFEFDEHFNEIINIRGKSELEYNNFSEGERLRIDCSIMFAFRELSKIRSSVSTNLLIADEMDRGVLDSSGFYAIKEILKTCKNENIILISHQADELSEICDRTIYVSKKDKFSVLNFS